MATGSALPLAGGILGAGNWPPSKDLGSHNSLPTNLSGEHLAVMSNGGSIYGSWRDSVPNRSGSAPPSMEGSLAAFDHLIEQQSGSLGATLLNLGTGVDDLKSDHQSEDPAFFECYGSKNNMKARLPPPVVSRESHHSMNWFGKARESGPFSLDDSSSNASGSRSLFRRLSALSTHKEEPENERSPPRLEPCSAEGAHCDYAQSTSNFGSHSSNILDLMQENFPQHTALCDNSSDPSDTDPCDGINSSKDSPLDVVKPLELNGFPQDTHQWSPRPIGSPLRNTLNINSILTSSPPASSCSNPNTIIQASEQGNPNMDIKPGGVVGVILDNLDSSMKNLKIGSDNQGNSHVMQQSHNNAVMQNGPSHVLHTNPLQMIPQGNNLPHIPFVDNFSHAHIKLQSSQLGMTTPFYTPSSFGSQYCENFRSPTVLAPPFGIDGYGLLGPFLPPAITNFAPQVMTPFGTPLTPNSGGTGFPSAINGAEYSHPYNIYEQPGLAMPPSVPDLSLIPCFQRSYIHRYGGGNPYDVMGPGTNFMVNPAGLFGSQEVLSETTHQSEKRFPLPINGASSSNTLGNGGNSVVNYQSTSPYNGIQTFYPANPMFYGQPLYGTHPHGRTDDAMPFQSSSKNMSTGSGIQGHQVMEKSNNPKVHCFVEELKSNRTHRVVELSEIKGHIMKYSSDQSGSRFIQQKLENCTTEEKALVFAEILPHASSLMIDVFGNYVIQKFFELGSPEQRRHLASKLVGQVLPLSLQMYGCRVIQKALEAIELEQKINLVRELDGHVLRCVHDQNGNHVIQKCIECLPMEHIGFIISSFQDQVANLSMHPYGCRVIQRILERCHNDSDGKSIIDEILESVCILSQDKYGNYVTQNVLERGKSHLRSQIISKLVGQVVSMSQNKYASNVIEKCFQHGDVAERDLLIKEIMEQTEGNNYLLVMMKDRFANYVVQKVLETCNEQQREALLSCITCHLEALKKFTYGKHIVSRVEQLCCEGAVYACKGCQSAKLFTGSGDG